MDFREALIAISDGFLSARLQPLRDHPLALLIRREVPRILADILGSGGDGLLVEASAGQGQWSASPWIRVADPTVSDAATRGYYPVYLFTVDMQAIVLTLAQGTTSVRQEFGREATSVLRSRAQILAAKVPEHSQRFPIGDISLRLAGRDQDREDWEASNAFAKEYLFDSLPPVDVILADLREMLEMYRLVIFRGGTEVLETSADDPDVRGDAGDGSEVEGRRRMQRHLRIERSRKLADRAKKIHGTQCQACGLSFGSVYGTRAEGYIEAHHLVPLSLVAEEGGIRRDPRVDFAVLCANCHRMIHRLNTPPLEDFRKQVHRELTALLLQLSGRISS